MDGEKITVQNGVLQIPEHPVIPFIIGDGIGPEIWAAASRVLDAAVDGAYQGRKSIVWKEVLAGEKAFNLTGEWLPRETIETIRECIVAIKGPLTTPVGGGIRSLNVALRQELDLYACVRPVRYFNGVPSPVKNPEHIDVVIFRENTEDIYTGIEFPEGAEQTRRLISFLQDEMGVRNIRFPKTSAIGIKPMSEEGSKRLVRAALRYAINEGRQSVTFVHKGNIMKFTEGAFKQWGYEVAEKEFGEKVFTSIQYDEIKERDGEQAAKLAQSRARAEGKILVKDTMADIFLEQILTHPKEFDVVATMNLNGDLMSDALAAQVGGVGIAPGANINYDTGHAVFEATHGTAPRFAGLNKVNPLSVILSGEMMLRYIGWSRASNLIINAMERTIASKTVTFDFACLMEDAIEVGTSEFATALIDNL